MVINEETKRIKRELKKILLDKSKYNAIYNKSVSSCKVLNINVVEECFTINLDNNKRIVIQVDTFKNDNEIASYIQSNQGLELKSIKRVELDKLLELVKNYKIEWSEC